MKKKLACLFGIGLAASILTGHMAIAEASGTETAAVSSDDEGETKEEESSETVEQEKEDLTEESADDPEMITDELVGGWSVPEEMPVIILQDEEREIFEKALEKEENASYRPVMVLATQVVAGSNLAYLCREGEGERPAWYVVVIYHDLADDATITSAQELSLTDLKTTDEHQKSGMTGAWSLHDPANAAVLSEEMWKAFQEAMEQEEEADLQPMVLLGQQVVAGMNDLILCRGYTGSGSEPEELYVTEIYEKLDGSAELTSVKLLDLLAYLRNEEDVD